MSEYVVVVADGSRARFFTLEPAEIPEMEGGPNLVEREDLANPEREAHDRELWSELKTGRNRAPNGGPAHGYDDHRMQHEAEFERRFARTVAERAAELARANGTRRVVLAAEKRMLGFLRNELGTLQKAGVEVREVPRDLSKLAPRQIHEHLAREGALPRRRSPAA